MDGPECTFVLFSPSDYVLLVNNMAPVHWRYTLSLGLAKFKDNVERPVGF